MDNFPETEEAEIYSDYPPYQVAIWVHMLQLQQPVGICQMNMKTFTNMD